MGFNRISEVHGQLPESIAPAPEFSRSVSMEGKVLTQVAHPPAALPMRTPLPAIEPGRSARAGSLKGGPHRPASVARVGPGKVANTRVRKAVAARR